MSEVIEALPVGGTEWVELGEWECEHNEYDAQGWLDHFGDRIGDRIGSGTAKLPNGGWVALERFCAIRQKESDA